MYILVAPLVGPRAAEHYHVRMCHVANHITVEMELWWHCRWWPSQAAVMWWNCRSTVVWLACSMHSRWCSVLGVDLLSSIAAMHAVCVAHLTSYVHFCNVYSYMSIEGKGRGEAMQDQ
jgi:hypothetical protein